MNNLDQYLEMLQSQKIIPEKTVQSIIEKAKSIFLEESNMVTVRSPVTVCGDTHGQFFDLMEIFEICGKLPVSIWSYLEYQLPVSWRLCWPRIQ